MASVRSHGKKFQVRYLSEGARQVESFDTLDAARIRAKEVELLLAKSFHVEARPHMVRFGELCVAVVNDYKINDKASTDDVERHFRNHVIPYFGDMRAASITGKHLSAYVALRKSEKGRYGRPVPNATINREMAAVKRAFNLGLEQGAIDAKPKHFPHLAENNVRKGFFTREEVTRLCRHLPQPLGDFTMFAFITAWRCDEVRNLKWANVDFQHGQIRLDPGETKNGHGRTFPMTTELREILEFQRARRDGATESDGAKVVSLDAKRSPFVFALRGRPIGAFKKTWKNACAAAGLPVVKDTTGKVIKTLRLFHDLRRSGARELQRAIGRNRAMVRSGHLTGSVYDRYDVVSDFDLEEDRKLLDAANHADAPAPSKPAAR